MIFGSQFERDMERHAHISAEQEAENWEAGCWLVLLFALACNLGLSMWNGPSTSSLLG